MKQKTKLIDPVNVDADGIAKSQTLTGADSLSLDGDLVSGGEFEADYPRRVSITSAGDDSGVTWTLTGYSTDGQAISEDLAGVASAAATSDIYFNGVTIIASDGATAAAVTAGTVDEIATNTIPIEHQSSAAAMVSLEDISGTLDVTVQETISDVQNADAIEWYDVTALTNKTSATRSLISKGATGVRFKVNSYTNGADFKGVIVQNRR